MKDQDLQLQKPRRSEPAAVSLPRLESASRHVSGGFIDNPFTSLQNSWASKRTPKGKVRSTDDADLCSRRTADDSAVSSRSSYSKTKLSSYVGPNSKRTLKRSIAPLQALREYFTSPPNVIPGNISPSLPDGMPKTASRSVNSDNDEQDSLLHCKAVASDCIVDFALSLPTALEHEWDLKLCGPVVDAIRRSHPDADFTVELVMARSSVFREAEPTILSMCSLSEHQGQIQRQIENILRRGDYVHNSTRVKVVVLDIERCTPGSLSAALGAVLHDEEILVDIAISKAGENSVLFGTLAKLYREKDVDSTVFSTIGGVISIEGSLYGLTTAHGLRSIGTRQQEGPRASGIKYRDATIFKVANVSKVLLELDILNAPSGLLGIKARSRNQVPTPRPDRIGHW